VNQAKVEQAIDRLAQLTNEERKEVFAAFCTECGANDPECDCWNDD
jgi:hypothetical protein